MLRIRPTYVVLTCALFLNAAPVSIFNDVTNTTQYTNSVVEIGPLGASFSTGGTPYTLTSVVLVLSSGEEEPTLRANRPTHGFPSHHASAHAAKVQKAKPSKVRPAGPAAPGITVALYTDTGGPGIGTLLATSSTTLLDTSLGADPAQFSFPFSYPLTANTRYWIVVTSPGDNSVAIWWGTSDMAGTEVTTEYYFENGEVTANSEEDGAFLLQVIGDPSTPPPTPGPASITLVLIGIGCAAWYFRRRRVFEAS
jgi:hypothetical protein